MNLAYIDSHISFGESTEIMDRFDAVREELKTSPRTWLVTGAAGFIGSNLVETLLGLDQKVVGMDNFFSGYAHNLDMVREGVAPEQWARFTFLESDIRDPANCRAACKGVQHILHQAALGSVPRSLEDPLLTNACNIDGHLNMLVAARDEGAQSFVYAASSSTYGDEPTLPKREELIGKPLSPYAATKYVNEIYADVFNTCYGFLATGLRYFNVFGRRQDPNGAYAAVIPIWFASLLRGGQITIHGDGETSRDFCYIDNCAQANILAALPPSNKAAGEVYNVAVGERTTLNELFYLIRDEVSRFRPEAATAEPVYGPFRAGDVRHSQADISKARDLLGFAPRIDAREGLRLAGSWYAEHM